MKKNMSQEVAFDIFADFMSRMIQKYGDSIELPSYNQVKCDSSEKKQATPADNVDSSAVVCMRETIISDKEEV